MAVTIEGRQNEVRGGVDGEPAESAAAAPREEAASPQAGRGGDGGLLLLFTLGVLFISLAVVVTALVGAMWVLVPVMLVDFVVTAIVFFAINRLLADD